MKRLTCGLAAAAFVTMLSMPLAAQPIDPPAGLSPGQVQQLFDAMLVMQAQEALGLSEPQYAQFLTRLRALQTARRRTQQERMKLLHELQRLTNPRAARPAGDDAVIRERLTALQELEARGAAELRQAYARIDEILDVRQQARFRVFEEQIERRKLELIARARQNTQARPNPNRPAPPRRPPGR